MATRATNTVSLTVRDVKRRGGEVLEQAAALGANQTYNIHFEVANAERLKDEARKQAMEIARKRAKFYAAAAGASLGRRCASPRPWATCNFPLHTSLVRPSAGPTQ